MNTKSLTTIFAAALIALGCSGDGPDKSQGNGSSFALGADISWTTKLEDMGCKFRSKDYKEKECTALMKEIGMNAIRLRVWVNRRTDTPERRTSWKWPGGRSGTE